MAPPLDIFGQPVKNTRPIGPKRQVHHRAASSTPTLAGTHRSNDQSPSRMIRAESPFMQSATKGAFKLCSASRFWYSDCLVPTRDPRRSPLMGDEMMKTAVTLAAAQRRANDLIAVRLSPSFASSPALVEGEQDEMKSLVVARPRAILNYTFEEPSVKSLLAPDDPAMAYRRSQLNELRHEREVRQRRAIEEAAGTTPACMEDAMEQSEARSGRAAPRRALDPQAAVDREIKEYERRVFKKELRRMERGMASSSAVDGRQRGQVPASSEVQRNPLAAVETMLALCSPSRLDRASPLSGAPPQSAAAWATVDRHRSYPFQREAEQRRQCDDAAMQAALLKTLKS